ncbi:MAG: hypothetical protein CO161_04360 [Candidatus Portnoybacteria bacterium CG_4_9_14_3_um_filter_44_9]|uniref:Uncharacterized protein n=1 Tax=Candidatus Portnoybacteria bacterium CG_4_9_14_3_um_filter_44_9 TaxID=1974806 RepID=A0A2M7YIM4_9BACT|nr:MAG: hypothetical protein CO161_04360 [Candidatus Portnoybacteria bacterium CG_4_9_14_3_um_filter_44_9]
MRTNARCFPFIPPGISPFIPPGISPFIPPGISPFRRLFLIALIFQRYFITITISDCAKDYRCATIHNKRANI